jgi:UDP-N-acetylmuramoylalanine--D-glutamate ligase
LDYRDFPCGYYHYHAKNKIRMNKNPHINPGTKLTILGGGESGVGTALLAKQKGYAAFLSDAGALKPEYKKELEDAQVPFEEGVHTFERLLEASEIVKSPGIPDTAKIIVAAREKGISVISEIEFAARFTNAKMVAITGSNGKTTTTMLTHHILKNAGINAALSGNVGISMARTVANSDADVYVLELSSFQLDGMFDFKADIAVLLNVTPDHLDRYDYKIENYTESKFRIIQNQGPDDTFVYCADDPIIQKAMSRRNIVSKTMPFSIDHTVDQGAMLREDEMLIKYRQDQMAMSLHKLALQGKHNLYNSMASGIVAKVLDIRDENIRESMSNYKNVPHRLEDCGQIQGINFINDSKATNVNAVWYALESMPKNVVWIVGGVDKGNDYEMLKDLVKEKVVGIVCLGVDNTRIKEVFGDLLLPMVESQNMDEAVNCAYHMAEKGFKVLLSPACASFDLFENYEDRGNQFKQSVREL